MATLTKTDILKQTALKREVVQIPEWGGEVIVQEMTALQRDQFEEWVLKKGEAHKESPKGTRVAIVINTTVDEDGNQLFSDLDAPDLNKKPAKIIDRIASVGLRLSGMEDAVDESPLEEEIKNSEAAQSGDSSSDSVEN